jgi:hypothetical protein
MTALSLPCHLTTRAFHSATAAENSKSIDIAIHLEDIVAASQVGQLPRSRMQERECLIFV